MRMMTTFSLHLLLLTILQVIIGNYSSDVTLTVEPNAKDLITNEVTKTDFKFADPPYNLTVQIIPLKGNKLHSLPRFSALVQWNATFDKRRRQYELVVAATSKECGQHFHTFHREILPTETNYTIKSAAYQEIRRGCSYNVSLSSVPPYHGFSAEHTIHTVLAVDDCLYSACKCAPSRLASFNVSIGTPKLLSKSTALISVKWNYSSNEDVNHFTVALFRQALLNKNKTMHLREVAHNVSYANVTSSYEVTFNVTLDEKYTVQVIGVDANQCRTSANKTFMFTAVTEISESAEERYSIFSFTLSIIVPVLSVTFAIYMGCFAWKRWNRKYKPARSYSIDFYSTPVMKSTSALYGQTCFFNESKDVNAVSQHFNINYVEKEIQQARDLGLVDFYEIHSGRLAIGHEIGKGAFGRVCIAKAESIAGIPGQTAVAVKFLRECSDGKERDDFLDEMAMMKKAGHHTNVVALLGCCTLQEPFCMVMEYVSFGDLLNYLRKLRSKLENSNAPTSLQTSVKSERKSSEQSIDDCHCSEESKLNHLPNLKANKSTYHAKYDGYRNTSLSSKTTMETMVFASDGISVDTDNVSNCPQDVALDSVELHNYAMQIANGMNHLAKRGIVHRDLAARNILIGDLKTLKISDFGLSRSGVYVTHRGGRVPLRWLSLEAIRNNLYSTESDVWAYGVVLWEICTLGGFPYSAITDNNVFGFLVGGRRLEKPSHCSEILFKLMNSCWAENPHHRPTFDELCEALELMSQEPHAYVNFDSTTSCELPPMTEDESVSSIVPITPSELRHPPAE